MKFSCDPSVLSKSPLSCIELISEKEGVLAGVFYELIKVSRVECQ